MDFCINVNLIFFLNNVNLNMTWKVYLIDIKFVSNQALC